MELELSMDGVVDDSRSTTLRKSYRMGDGVVVVIAGIRSNRDLEPKRSSNSMKGSVAGRGKWIAENQPTDWYYRSTPSQLRGKNSDAAHQNSHLSMKFDDDEDDCKSCCWNWLRM